jgi:hypothetical protein
MGVRCCYSILPLYSIALRQDPVLFGGKIYRPRLDKPADLVSRGAARMSSSRDFRQKDYFAAVAGSAGLAGAASAAGLGATGFAAAAGFAGTGRSK